MGCVYFGCGSTRRGIHALTNTVQHIRMCPKGLEGAGIVKEAVKALRLDGIAQNAKGGWGILSGAAERWLADVGAGSSTGSRSPGGSEPGSESEMSVSLMQARGAETPLRNAGIFGAARIPTDGSILSPTSKAILCRMGAMSLALPEARGADGAQQVQLGGGALPLLGGLEVESGVMDRSSGQRAQAEGSGFEGSSL